MRADVDTAAAAGLAGGASAAGGGAAAPGVRLQQAAAAVRVTLPKAPCTLASCPRPPAFSRTPPWPLTRPPARQAEPETCTYGCGAVVWGGLSFGGDL